MYKDHSVLAIVPARGGSKGIPGKNIIEVAGKPLVAYTLDAAKKSSFIDYVLVSTDSEEIAEVSKEYGAQVPFLRPAELATDTAKTSDAIFHAVKEMENLGRSFDAVVLLQPTSPLRTGSDIDAAIELFFEEGERSVVSVSEAEINPVLIRRVVDGKAVPILNTTSTVRRQDFEKFYRVNGAIYVNKASEISRDTSFNDNELAFVMEKNHCLDIDTMEDLENFKKAVVLRSDRA
ncbi:MAG: acylneuraminate cytidylyltransferase family protein [Butyrivibrio sp.]|nr:acylneuraminate cytidylyltransferase family protein [Butyrivibrio sp.]